MASSSGISASQNRPSRNTFPSNLNRVTNIWAVRSTPTRITAAALLLLAAWYINAHIPRPVRVQVGRYGTQQPMAGAVVAVRWYAADPFCFHGDCIRAEAAVGEAVTGADGVTVVKPKRYPRGLLVVRGEPKILVHKAGYAIFATMERQSMPVFLLERDTAPGSDLFIAATAEAVTSDFRVTGKLAPLPLMAAELTKTARHPPRE